MNETLKLSKGTSDLILELNEFSHNKIKNPADISSLLELSFSDITTFDDIIFIAKYLNGLGKILHTGFKNIDADKISSGHQQDSLLKVRNEYKSQLEKFILLLQKLIKNIPEEKKDVFKNKYLKMNQSSMVNLTTLIYDLCWVKQFKNKKK
jgi:hypothetical protein